MSEQPLSPHELWDVVYRSGNYATQIQLGLMVNGYVWYSYMYMLKIALSEYLGMPSDYNGHVFSDVSRISRGVGGKHNHQLVYGAAAQLVAYKIIKCKPTGAMNQCHAS